MSQPPVELDIVIPVYGQPELLRQCLASLAVAGFDVNYRVIVVDDKSPNGTEMEPIYSTLNGNSKLVRNPENRGFPGAANRGAAEGSAPAILFLNSDVTLKGGAIRAMLKTLWSDASPQGIIPDPAEHAPVGVVGPKLLFPDGTPFGPAGKVQHAGMAFNGAGIPIHIHIDWSEDHPKVNMQRSLQCVTGACLMTRRATWEAVIQNYRIHGDPTSGGFNEMYGRGTWEDVEYCFAARGAGFKVVYEPAAVGYHHVGASSAAQGQGFDQKRNEQIFKARCGHLIVWDEAFYW